MQIDEAKLKYIKRFDTLTFIKIWHTGLCQDEHARGQHEPSDLHVFGGRRLIAY